MIRQVDGASGDGGIRKKWMKGDQGIILDKKKAIIQIKQKILRRVSDGGGMLESLTCSYGIQLLFR